MIFNYLFIFPFSSTCNIIYKIDAEDALRKLDGYRLEGDRIQVEYAKGKRSDRDRGRGRDNDRDRDRGRAQPGSDRCYNCGEIGHM